MRACAMNDLSLCAVENEGILCKTPWVTSSIDCKTVVFFANASDGVGPSSNERSGASVKMARENGERRGRVRLARHSRVTLMALRAFRNNRKRLFCSLPRQLCDLYHRRICLMASCFAEARFLRLLLSVSFCFLCYIHYTDTFEADWLQMIVVAKKYICVATVHQ